MFIPELMTSAITLSAVLFQLSLFQPLILAFSLLLQILCMSLVNTRLPSYINNTPTICKCKWKSSFPVQIPSKYLHLVKFSSLNLVVTTLLFLSTLILRRLSQSNSNIPLPRSLYVALTLADKILPVPKGSKEVGEESMAGNYSDVALTLNNLVFCLVFIIYLLVIVPSFFL
jgi:small-conductance mechanosensitive channel